MGLSLETIKNFSFKRIKFEHNVGEKDQKIRYGIGIVLVLISLFLANVFFLLLGIVLIGSAYLTWCPVLSGLGMNTCSADAAKSSTKE